MKQCGPLPDVMIPFAERMFAWFPEVFVALGHPTLQDQFALPPHPSVQMTLEETAEHKLILVKLIRRQRRRIALCSAEEDDDSPFSKSRATAPAHSMARQAAAVRSVNMDIRPEPQAIQSHRHSSQRSQAAAPRVVNDAYIPVRAEGSNRARNNNGNEGSGRQNLLEDPMPMDQRPLAERKNTGLQGDPEENQRKELLAKQQQQNRRQAAQLSVSGMRASEQQHLQVTVADMGTSSSASVQPVPQEHGQQQQQLRHQQLQPTEHLQLPDQQDQPMGRRRIESESKTDGYEIQNQSLTLDVGQGSEQPSLVRSATSPAQIEGSLESPKVSAAGGRQTAKKKVMGKSDADPGSPKLSSPGSHNPWDVKLPEAALSSSMSTPEPEAAVATQVHPRRMSETCRPPREPAMSFSGTSVGSIQDTPTNPFPNVFPPLERAATWCGGSSLAVPPSPPISEGSHGGDRFPLPLTPTPKGTSPQSVPLSVRRNMQIQNHWRKTPKEFSSTGSSAGVLDILNRTTRKDMPVMPGAFQNCRTLFIFDWDDTLCPTTWIRDQLKTHIADSLEWSTMSAEEYEKDWRYQIPAWFGQPLPDIPDIRDKIDLLQTTVMKVIDLAQSLGVVCIVTNAVEGWVRNTINKWMPKLGEYIFGHGFRPSIKVLYGQVEYKKAPRAYTPANDVEDLQFSELVLWKKVAMCNVLKQLHELYRVAPSSGTTDETISSLKNGPDNLLNIVSIGDSEFEMVSGELVTLEYQDRDKAHISRPANRLQRPQSAPATRELHGRPLFKAIKLLDGPSIDDIIKQLELLTKSLKQIVASRSHFRIDAENNKNQFIFTARRGEWSATSDGPENPDVLLERLLRTQTI